LAAGLLWAWWADRRELKIFFLGCVVVAGAFGGMTAKTSILITQALPAALALGLVVVASRRGGQWRRTPHWSGPAFGATVRAGEIVADEADERAG
jgi:hypothetical protein